MRFEQVANSEIDRWWPEVRPGLERIKYLCDEQWMPEAIYHFLRMDRAALFIFHEEKPCGFCILERCQDPVTGSAYLNVWLLHFVNRLHGDSRRDLRGFLDEWGRKSGGVIRFVSPRPGWARYLGKDFKQKAVIYERKVP